MKPSRPMLAVALLVGLLPLSAASAASVTLGYTGTGTPAGGPLPTAAAAQSAFLASLGTYYTEDFQDFTLGSTIGTNKSLTLPGFSGTASVTASNNADGKTTVEKGNPGNWGDFGGLAGSNTATNLWLGVHSSLITFNFSSVVRSVGFLVNDARDLGTGKVGVTWSDGTTSNLALASLGASVAGQHLSNQNVYFVGLKNTLGISSISLAGGSNTDGFAIDQLVIGGPEISARPTNAAIPLPPSAYAGIALAGFVVARRYYKFRNA